MVAFIGFTSFIIFKEPIGRFTRAANTNTPVSLQKSLIFAWPLTVAADNQASSEVTIFIRDEEGKGLNERQVTLQTTVGTVDTATALTNGEGKVIFKLTSATKGVAKIEASVDNKKLQRSVTVQFE